MSSSIFQCYTWWMVTAKCVCFVWVRAGPEGLWEFWIGWFWVLSSGWCGDWCWAQCRFLFLLLLSSLPTSTQTCLMGCGQGCVSVYCLFWNYLIFIVGTSKGSLTFISHTEYEGCFMLFVNLVLLSSKWSCWSNEQMSLSIHFFCDVCMNTFWKQLTYIGHINCALYTHTNN